MRVLALLALIAPSIASAALIESVYPTGSVKQVQQVTVRFSDDMVPLGDPRSKTPPLTLECNVKAQGGKRPKAGETKTPEFTTRWADSKNWVLEFHKPLASGIQCKLKPAENLKSLAGDAVSSLQEYSFSTGGPALLALSPSQHQALEPEPYIVLQTDGAMDLKSVEKTAHFEVEGMPGKLPIRVIQGRDRDTAVRAAITSAWQWSAHRRLIEQKGADFAKLTENFFVIAPQRRLPESTKVVLHWPLGILSRTGVPVDEPQRYEYRTIAPFTVRFTCERDNSSRPCNPILPLGISFSSPVHRDLLKGAALKSGARTWTSEELQKPSSSTDDPYITSFQFQPPFPENAEFEITLPKGIKDEIGRALKNAAEFPLKVKTDQASPLVKFAAPFGVLELKADPALPVSLRNVETVLGGKSLSFEGFKLNLGSSANPSEIISWYRKVESKSVSYEKRGQPLLTGGTPLKLPKPLPAKELELVGIPLKTPGLHIVEVESPKLGAALLGAGPMYVASAALVTDIGVHFKKGRESSLVWTTALSTGAPISGVKITVTDGAGETLIEGTTDRDGLLRIENLKDPCAYDVANQPRYERCELFAFAKKGDDFSFVSSNWSKGIETYRFDVTTEYLEKAWGPKVLHTVLDRMLAQPGDKIQMKHILREHRSGGFGAMDASRLPKRVLVIHAGSSKTYTLPFEYDPKTGSAVSTFTIPKDAALGHYSIQLSNKDKLQQKNSEGEDDPRDWDAQGTGYFTVAEYRIPLMKATAKIQNADALVAPKSVRADLSAAYLSGGVAKNLKITVRGAIYDGGFFSPPALEGFSTFAEPMKVGIQDRDRPRSDSENFLHTDALTLDAQGGTTAEISGIPASSLLRRLHLEMEYSDPSGEIRTETATATLFPAETVVGLKNDSWMAKPDQVEVSGIVTDLQGKPLAGRAYSVEALQSFYYSHRKRLIGGFYSYDSKNEVKSLGKVCEGKSDADGRFICKPKNLPAGDFTLQASVKDGQGRVAYARAGVNVYAPGAYSWWTPSDSDRIDLIPEKKRYEPGETARFSVRTPFPKAHALITVEREGVLDARVLEINREKPILELPLRGNYAPNIFVSALLIRGRVEAPRATALVDLARPSMKMGLSEIRVGWKAHELEVKVEPERKKYQTREKVKAKISVKSPDGSPLPAGSEVAIAVVDEGLLSLKENTSWKLLSAMMGARPLAVRTSSLQNQIIGKRHYGAKAKAPGGDGGAGGSTRELFEPMLYWNPRVKLGADGTAQVTFALNDSITSFRIVAVATGGLDRFGDGMAEIVATKDLIVYPGFAPLVRDGDKIRNVFTLRNTTEKPMKVKLAVSSKARVSLPALPDVELAPSSAKTLEIPVDVPAGLKELQFKLTATDTLGSKASDSVAHTARVEQAVPVRVTQSTLLQLENKESIPVQLPADALPGRGGISIHARETLVRGLVGVKQYMADYPYTCMEQQISRFVTLENKVELQKLIAQMPGSLDGDGLLKFFPISMCGSKALTRYALAILAENGYTLPEATLSPMLKGLEAALADRLTCNSWWNSRLQSSGTDQDRILTMEVLSRFGKFTPSMLGTVPLAPNTWSSETVAAWHRLLKRVPQIPGREAHLKQAENILRARVNFQGTAMNLQNVATADLGWVLFTSPDQEALQVFAVALEEPSWSKDAGRMARGLLGRLKHGHFDTTLANSWAVTRMRAFSAAFEKEKVTGTTKATLGEASASFDWAKSPAGGVQELAWPSGAQAPLALEHSGGGKPWMQLQARAAIPLKSPLELGYSLKRKVTPILQAQPGQWSIGDIANVEITVEARADQPWVVVRDPIPAGAAHLGTGLSGGSQILNRDPKAPAAGGTEDFPLEYEEKSHAHYTGYAAYLPKGTYRLNYRIRLNSAGLFQLPPARVEAMYSPESFGETPHAPWPVEK